MRFLSSPTFRLNLIQFSIILLYLIVQRVFFPFAAIAILFPLIVTYFVVVNLLFSLYTYILKVYGGNLPLTDKRKEKAKKWFTLIVTLCTIVFILFDLIDLQKTKQLNDKRAKDLKEHLEKKGD